MTRPARRKSIAKTVAAATAVIALAAAFTHAAPPDAAAPVAAASAPSSQPAGRTPQAIMLDFQKALQDIQASIPNPEAVATPEGRKSVAEAAIPALKKGAKLLDELAGADPRAKGASGEFKTLLLIFNDPATIAEVDKIAAGKGTEALTAQAQRAAANYVKASNPPDAAAQIKALDEYTTALKAEPTNQAVQSILSMFIQTDAASPDVTNHLVAFVRQAVPGANGQQLAETILAQQKIRSMMNKPLVIDGAQADGKPFSTAAWKGKVVLVDFWATWCPPCVAEMPKLKEMYAKDHDKGLEVLGISSDYKTDDLTKFVKDQSLPWPQLFDPKAAQQMELNSIATGFGIKSLPVTFLIDRAGVLRSVGSLQEMEVELPKLLAQPPSAGASTQPAK